MVFEAMAVRQSQEKKGPMKVMAQRVYQLYIFNPQAVLTVYQLFYFRGTVYLALNGLMTDGRTPH